LGAETRRRDESVFLDDVLVFVSVFFPFFLIVYHLHHFSAPHYTRNRGDALPQPCLGARHAENNGVSANAVARRHARRAARNEVILRLR